MGTASLSPVNPTRRCLHGRLGEVSFRGFGEDSPTQDLPIAAITGCTPGGPGEPSLTFRSGRLVRGLEYGRWDASVRLSLVLQRIITLPL